MEYQLEILRLESEIDAYHLFKALYRRQKNSFWLDSNPNGHTHSRYSFMGAVGQGTGKEVSYQLSHPGVVEVIEDGVSEHIKLDIFQYLESELSITNVQLGEQQGETPILPFMGGYIGYLGYELKALTGSSNLHQSSLPDAHLLFPYLYLALDHDCECMYIVSLAREDQRTIRARQVSDLCQRIVALNNADPSTNHVRLSEHNTLDWEQDRQRYITNIHQCLDLIHQGESYEICLTNRLSGRSKRTALDLYHSLRLSNPAPYSAYMHFAETSVLCSSPEKFLTITCDGQVVAKPIKGTSGRSQDREEDARLKHQLQMSTKDRCENLLITDLIRNDLSRVCRVGSVKVSKLMDIESFQSVHQMVTTIEGELQPDKSSIDCVKACFPGGSMTGAPKLRTLEIIDRLEDSARGIYSGCLGYFSLDGAIDLNIVIRTIVLDKGEVSIGSGGAIVALSNAELEFEEIELKSQILARVVTDQ